MKDYDIAIIGAGHNGLIAACYLAKAGFSVGVFERNKEVGGAAVTREGPSGFTYFEGPHVLTGFSPSVMRELDLSQYGLDIIPLPGRTTLNAEGQFLTTNRDERQSFSAIKYFSLQDAEMYRVFLRDLTRQKRIAALSQPRIGSDQRFGKRYLREDVGKWLGQVEQFGKDALSESVRLWTSSCADYLQSYFQEDIVQAHIASPVFMGVDKGPFCPATAFLLLRCGFDQSLHGAQGFVRGGMNRLSHALESAAKDAGVDIHLRSEVIEVQVEKNKVRGLTLIDSTSVKAKVVVSSLDLKRSVMMLFDWKDTERGVLEQARNYKLEGTLAKLNIALDGLPKFPNLPQDSTVLGGLMNFVSNLFEIEAAYDAWRDQIVPSRPFLEITIPSVMDPSLAPTGKHLMSVYVQYIPTKLLSGPWDTAARERLATIVIDQIAAHSPDFTKRIEDWSLSVPRDFEDKFSLTNGDVFHGQLSLSQILSGSALLGSNGTLPGIDGFHLCSPVTTEDRGMTGLPGARIARRIARGFEDE